MRVECAHHLRHVQVARAARGRGARGVERGPLAHGASERVERCRAALDAAAAASDGTGSRGGGSGAAAGAFLLRRAFTFGGKLWRATPPSVTSRRVEARSLPFGSIRN